GDDHLPAAGEEDVDGARELAVEAVAQRRERGAFDLEHASGAREPLGRHARTSRNPRSIAASSRRRAGSSASGRLVAPSERARLGSSCTSMKTALTPAATAARARSGT